MPNKLTAEFLFDDLTSAEKSRAKRVESVLVELRAHAEESDAAAALAAGDVASGS